MVGSELTIFGNIIGAFYNISLADYYTSIRGFVGVSTAPLFVFTKKTFKDIVPVIL